MNETGKNPEVIEAESQMTPAEMKAHLGKLIEESPSRRRGRFMPDYSLTKAYSDLLAIDTSKMSDKEKEEHANKLFKLKKFGTYTDEMRQSDIDYSLNSPLSESFRMRDEYMAEIEKLEKEIDSFDISEVQAEADKIAEQYTVKMKGANSHQRAVLKSDYDRAISELEHRKITLPMNDMKVKRAELIERLKVVDSRIKLYVSINKDAINRQIEKARDDEISQNLLALVEYMEG